MIAISSRKVSEQSSGIRECAVANSSHSTTRHEIRARHSCWQVATFIMAFSVTNRRLASLAYRPQWEAHEFPQLAANEYFCLKVAKRCGFEVPPCRLAEDAQALVIDRFDLRPDGTYRGFEDFCVLNAKRTDQKYSGSYETSIIKRFQQFADSPHIIEDLEKLFTLIAINCALRNGDAHLKNFGIVYDDVLGVARLAPVYDLVTTAVYMPNDSMALTLNGSTKWPSAKDLRRLGETRMAATPSQVKQILERVANAMSHIADEVRSYIKEHPEFGEIGERILEVWEQGRDHALY